MRSCRDENAATVSLRLFDTAARSLVDFQPLVPGHVGLYTCGPTVYNRVHIGNLRTFVWEDVMCRAFRSLGLSVTQVMNLTDIDDKTIRGAVAEGLPLREFTDRHIATFFEDLKTLERDPGRRLPARDGPRPRDGRDREEADGAGTHLRERRDDLVPDRVVPRATGSSRGSTSRR